MIRHNKTSLMLFPISVFILIVAIAELAYGDHVTFDFRIEPSDLVVRRDEPAILDCLTQVTAGHPLALPKIRWRRDGEFLTFPDYHDRRRLLANGSLYFSTVEHSRTSRPDEGLYQCVATVEGLGTIISRTAKLRVAGLASSFTTEPETQTVSLGDTAVFECSIGSVPEKAIATSWLKNDQKFLLDHRMKVLPSGTLEIAGVQLSDRDSYRCEVLCTVTMEAKLSSRAFLNINFEGSSNEPEAPKFILMPRNAIAEVGETLTLDCAANGVPAPFITWLKDGATIDVNHLDSRFTKIGRGGLQIRNATLGDEGTYQCRAENTEDSTDAVAFVEIQAKPRFLRTPSSASASVRSDVELECEVFGKPEPTVQWYKNGDLIIESDYFQIVRGTNLKILGLVEADSGMYQCVASNPIGNIQTSANLKVLRKVVASAPPVTGPSLDTLLPVNPSMASSKKSVISEPSAGGHEPHLVDNVFLKAPGPPRDVTAIFVSTRFITVSWRRPGITNGDILGYSVFYKQYGSDRERVLNSTSGDLEEMNIQDLSPDTQYEIRVVAVNQNGVGESSLPLTVSTQKGVDVPGPVTDLSARPTSAFSILISWGPPKYNSASKISHYKLYYRQVDHGDVRSVTTDNLQYHLTELPEYTEFTFWVSGFNSNGEGAFSEEVRTRTRSDLPADPPQNVTVESDSSKSIIVRWHPPPKESQNGIITGYKIRWRKSRTRKSDVVTTDGSRRLYAITGLENGVEYQVKMAAMTVNGTGPSTSWFTTRTYDSDLNESEVPKRPGSIEASATDTEITAFWTPPEDKMIRVRGYTIGWGKGIPDEQTTVIEDDKRRSFVIPNLRPSTEYVISLRAFNNVGDGRIIYETVWTKDEGFEVENEVVNDDDEEEDGFLDGSRILQPPIKLHARILSSKSALLTWMDSTLPSNQLIPDNRYYVVRYTALATGSHKAKHQFRNSTNLNIMVDDLKPDTEYHFRVKVVRGRRQSAWSLITTNRTEESAPSSPPRNLLIRPTTSKGPGTVLVSWDPPKHPNGLINGYIVLYSTDRMAEEREWFVEAIVGDQTNALIHNLTPNMKYYFKIGARNSKGYGPYGPIEAFKVPLLGGSSMSPSTSTTTSSTSGQGVNPIVLYAIAGVSAGIVLVLIIAGAILIHRCGQQSGAAAVVAVERHNKNSYLSAEPTLGGQKDHLNPPPPPPDLWLGQDQLELKSMVDCDGDGDETGETSIARSTPIDYRSASSIDRSRNYIMTYSGTESEASFSVSVAGGKKNRISKAMMDTLKSNSSHHHHQQNQPLLASNDPTRPVKIAAINGKPRVQRYLSHESVASGSHAGSSCNGSSSTYIRSQFNTLNPPNEGGNFHHHAHGGNTPGYEPASSERSVPSTIEESGNWSGGNSHGDHNAQFPVPVAPPQLPPTYLSSAMSTSSADSSSGTSGATRSSRQSGSSGSQPPGMKSFGPGSMLPEDVKNKTRVQPSSPFKRHQWLPTSTSSGLASVQESSSSPTLGTPLHSGQLPPINNVRSPDVLHPQHGPCDCLSHPKMPSMSTEDLHAEMKNLEGLMKDLTSISDATKAAPKYS